MDRERFNHLLLDPSKITDNDIRALNEYRKKYPFFQSLYVIVAKALKDRNHPKTDAFIKKAAIYSANRAHLKNIIEGDFDFNPNATVEEEQEAVVQKEQVTIQEPTPTAKTKELEDSKDQVEKESKDASSKENVRKESEPEEAADASNDLDEIKATKKRIEALLAGTYDEPKSASTKKEKKSSAKATTNQVELIEKFIKDEPQIEVQRISEQEGKSNQEDLASKSLKGSESFETETLAKLMTKQRKYKKAIQIYERLSLKFPEKSTYFATRIEEVKKKQNV